MPGEPGNRTWSRGAARFVAAFAAAFVLWQAIVESVRLDYAVEARLLGDMQALVSSQAAYAAVNFGFYDKTECLQAPSNCLRRYPASGPVFLDPYPRLGTVRYYRRRFVSGAGVDPKELPTGASRSSMKTFAYVAVPAEPGGIRGLIWRMAGFSLEGVRAFCADSTGRICTTDGGAEPGIVDGICAPECKEEQ